MKLLIQRSFAANTVEYLQAPSKDSHLAFSVTKGFRLILGVPYHQW
jgi:hypothetical protein